MKFNEFNNTGSWMLDSVYHMALKLLWNHIVGIKTERFCHYVWCIHNDKIFMFLKLLWMSLHGTKSIYSKTCLKQPLKRDQKLGFQDQLSLIAVQKYCRMLQESILQYFWHALSYHLSLRPLFCLFLSGCLRQVFLYIHGVISIPDKSCNEN